MRLFLTILYDSFLETLDRKTFYVLVAISTLIILLGASVSFEPRPVTEVVQARWGEIRWIEKEQGLASARVHLAGPILALDRVEEMDGGVLEVDVRVLRPEDARQLTRTIVDNRLLIEGDARVAEKMPRASSVESEDQPPLTTAEAESLFRELAARDLLGFESLEERTGGYLVRLAPPHPYEISGAGRMSMFFGAVDFELAGQSFAGVLLTTQATLASLVAGFFGILIAVVVTAGFFPNMLQDGSVDLLVSKPIHRWAIFFAKYVGGLMFVLLNSAYLIGGFWFVTSIRSGFYNFGFLGTILSVTALFAVIYSISVFWAVMTRSTVVSILMSIVFWFVCYTVKQSLTLLLAFKRQGVLDTPDAVISAVKFFYYLLPSTSDFDMLGLWFVSRAPISEAGRDKFLASSGWALSTYEMSLSWSLATTAIFTLAVLVFTAWRFQKRDF